MRTLRLQAKVSLLLAGLIGCSVLPVHAQRNFSLTLTRTNQSGVAIQWKAQSATPAGDLVLVPQFRVERSPDLKTWTAISGKLAPRAG